MKGITPIVLVLLVVSCGTPRVYELPHSHPYPERVKDVLRSMVIPHVAMRSATNQDAMEFLSKASVEYDSKGISLILSLLPDVPTARTPSEGIGAMNALAIGP
jgi:hypothetical protein